MKRLILLRPEPGLTASRLRAEALGLEVVAHPLFSVESVAAVMPAKQFDGIVVTSANAVRHGKNVLRRFVGVPVHAVGEATADALRSASITVSSVGDGGVEGMVLPAGRLLHLCGETHKTLPVDAVALPVYRTVATPGSVPDLSGAVVAVHSPAAGERLDQLAGDGRAGAVVAAISPVAAAAVGGGWQAVHSANVPDDRDLLALAAALCQSADNDDD